jgi:hypothetical protein
VVIFYAVWAAISFFGLIIGTQGLSKQGQSPVLWIIGSGVTVFLLAYAAYRF